MEKTVDSYNVLVILMSLVTLVFGLLTAYFYHNGQTTNMFITLVIGFVMVYIDFYFMDKRADLVTGKTVDCPLK